MAPEVIRHEAYDQRCDVYSFAILAWEMLTYRIRASLRHPLHPSLSFPPFA